MKMLPILSFLFCSTRCNFLCPLLLLICLLLLIPDDLSLKQTFKLVDLSVHQLFVFFELQAFFDHLKTPNLVLLMTRWCGTAEIIWNSVGGQKSWSMGQINMIIYLQRWTIQRILNLVIIKGWFFFYFLLLILNISLYISHKIHGHCLRLGWS